MQKLYFVRHGESADNAAEIWARVDTRLTEKGRTQAHAAGQKARKQGLHFDVIISSPFPRALETAQIIAVEIGYPVEKIETADILTERNFGSLTGSPHQDFWKDGHVYKDLDEVAGIERIRDLQMRAAEALDYIRARPEANILVVGHGTYGRAFRRVINSEPYEMEYTGDFPTHRLQNGEIIELI